MTTSGVGERLGFRTNYMNKSLLPVGDQPAIARIFDTYPSTTEFVVTLGYKGDSLRQFLELAFPERIIHFVLVDRYEGPGSSLAYSMLAAQEFLMEPFVYNAGDSIWPGNNMMDVESNALAGFPGGDSNLYASFDVAGAKVTKIHGKRMTEFDLAYIGVASIHSYERFWETLDYQYQAAPDNKELNDLSAITAMLEEGFSWQALEVDSWFDTGSVVGLRQARAAFEGRMKTLEKQDEAIFKSGDTVLKFFADSGVVEKRVQRAELLGSGVPAIGDYRDNWYTYKYVDGRPLSETISPNRLEDLLYWAKSTIWDRGDETPDEPSFVSSCESFYYEKSLKRLQQFVEKTGLEDSENLVNGRLVPTATQMISHIQTSGILTFRPGQFHGDFVLDNILDLGENFVAIDWRQDFGGSLRVGDVHYDLAKLSHSFIMDHNLLNDSKFVLEHRGNEVFVDISVRDSQVELESVLEVFCLTNGYGYEAVQILTPLIWINMAPLHTHPIDSFLFFYGRSALWSRLEKIGLKF